MNTRDEHDVRKSAIEDSYIAADEEREELHRALIFELSKIGYYPNAPALDANLIATAKQKLLTTDQLRGRFVVNLNYQCPTDHFWPRVWALTQASVTHEARAILEAIKCS